MYEVTAPRVVQMGTTDREDEDSERRSRGAERSGVLNSFFFFFAFFGVFFLGVTSAPSDRLWSPWKHRQLGCTLSSLSNLEEQKTKKAKMLAGDRWAALQKKIDQYIHV